MTASRRDPHLGELAAALVDGALDHNARDRALAHMMRCECCRAEVDAQRRLKAQLAQIAFPPVSSGLAERLLSLPDRTAAQSAAGLPPARFEARFRTPARLGGPPQATGDRVLNTRGSARAAVSVHAQAPVHAPVQVLSRPGSGRPATTSSPRGPGRHPRSRRRRIAATAAGGLAAFALSFATVAAVGGIDEPPPVAPQIGTFITEHDQGSAGVPGRDPEMGAVDATSTGR
jgi:hypothetical protein